MSHEAILARALKDNAVQCLSCEHHCTLKPGEWGKCGVRINQEGKLSLTVYGRAVAAHIDPIEKKPLFHFLPGSRALSIGTYGCNLECQWCQNWELSATRQVTENRHLGELLLPAQVVDIARRQDIPIIAYTYNEPTVFFEYTYDTAQIAHKYGIKNVYVSNGFMTLELIKKIEPYLDGINVDLKGFTEELYKTYCGARLEPVKRNIAFIANKTNIWIEVTTLIIPNLNDSDDELKAIATWLANVDPLIPWHVTAFYPTYKMQDRPRTPPTTLERAYDIGKAAGLQNVYVGNILDQSRECTFCHQCRAILIERLGYRIKVHWDKPGICPQCGTPVPGVWETEFKPIS